MTNSRRLALGAVLLASVACVSCGGTLVRGDRVVEMPASAGGLQTLPQREQALRGLKPGDVVFSADVGELSDLVRAGQRLLRGSPAVFTHAGVAVQLRPGGQLWIAEALPDRGVALTTPEAFAQRVKAVIVVSVAGEAGEVGAEVSAQALRYLGRVFDFELDSDDASALYCTELVARALEGAGVDVPVAWRDLPVVGKRVKRVVLPDDLYLALRAWADKRRAGARGVVKTQSPLVTQ